MMKLSLKMHFDMWAHIAMLCYHLYIHVKYRCVCVFVYLYIHTHHIYM